MTTQTPRRPRPPLLQLNRRRRQVLCLRAYGCTYAEIARELKIPIRLVHKDLQACGRIVPRSRHGQGRAATNQSQLMYVFGLLDADMDPEEIVERVRGLPDRVKWLGDMNARDQATREARDNREERMDPTADVSGQ